MAYNKAFVSYRNKGIFPWEVVKPTQWELLLKELKLSDNDALKIVSSHSNETSKKIKKWVYNHYRILFVPENILEVMGIDCDL